MKVDVATVPEDGFVLNGTLDPSFIDIDTTKAEFKRPVTYVLEIRRAGKTLIVRGDVSTVAELVCSRCLKKFEFEIRIKNFRAQIEIKDPEIVIDLTDKIREDIIFTLPYKPLCQPECSGICPSCGKDLNEGTCNCPERKRESPLTRLSEIFPGNRRLGSEQ